MFIFEENLENKINMSYEDSRDKAILIYKELNRINNKLHKNNKSYFKHNIPLSLFENDDGEINLT
jgi:hypothetical protein